MIILSVVVCLSYSVIHKGKNFHTKEWVERVVIAGVNTEPKNIHMVKAGEFNKN